MTAIPYWHVDAFAGQAFGGNQAAVMLFDRFPEDATMLAIAAENLFAETAFVVATPDADADYDLRWFTPAVEVALCGHATLAAGHVLLAQDMDRRGKTHQISFATRKSGMLTVRRAGNAYELALPAIAAAAPAPDGIADGLGHMPEEIVWNDAGYLICRFASEADVRALTPDMAALASHGDTMFICTAAGEDADVVSRVFVPGAGVPEDSVTGSAHAALTPFWAARLGRSAFTAHQASARGGDLTCRLDGERAIIGGECVTVVEGSFHLGG